MKTLSLNFNKSNKYREGYLTINQSDKEGRFKLQILVFNWLTDDKF